jgi:cystathionine beta-lyase
VRVERAEANALAIARHLALHPRVRRVHYACLDDHAGRALHASQARGAGSVVSFETGDAELSRRVVESLELFTISVSFGNVASLASLPCRMSHKSIPAHVRAERALPEDLVRLSIGIEDVRDLIPDLDRALNAARRPDRRCGGRRSARSTSTGSPPRTA